jgi:transglutaminase-like putative cysteine protease
MKLAEIPRHKVQPYRGTTDTVREMTRLAHGPRGELSLKLRSTVENIVRGVRPRDRLSQLAAIYDWFEPRFYYINDPVQVELVKDPERLLEEIAKHGKAMGDCDDASIFFYAAPRTIGIPTQFARVGFKDRPMAGKYTHILVVATDQYKRPIVLDPVAGPRTASMLSKVKHSVMGY